MEYRINRRTGDKIGVIGFGTSAITETSERERQATFERAFECGINYYDLATSAASCFPSLGNALGNVRDKVLYQVHFGAEYSSGNYGWTTDLDAIKRSVEWQLKNLKTDYIDYAFIHCMDEQTDWNMFVGGGVFDYITELKRQGIARHIGVSSHTPRLVNTVLDIGAIDMVMFSINPAYDWERGDDWGKGSASERTSLYRRCEAEGVGISVMKAFSGGQLLSEKTSPFGVALTDYQCLRYALDKPGVLTVLPGVSGIDNLDRILGYFSADETQKDYTTVASLAPNSVRGNCVYCNHCQPCPVGIDIGTVNKYYDLALVGDALAAEHYKTLSINANDCIHCGHCDSRCPFKSQQSSRMSEIAAYFKQ